MSDAATLGKDIAADASQKAANQVRPSEEDLAQIDQAAEDNVWHEKPNINKDDLKSKFKRNKAVCFTHIRKRTSTYIIAGQGEHCLCLYCREPVYC